MVTTSGILKITNLNIFQNPDLSPERPAIDDSSSSCPSENGSEIEITVPIDHRNVAKQPEEKPLDTPMKPIVIPKEQYSSIGWFFFLIELFFY